MSGKLHHGKEAFEGFRIASEGKYQRKLIEIMPDGTELRPWDFSITKNVISLFISIFLILVIFLTVAKRYRENFARAPKGIQSWLEPIILFICDDIAKPSIGKEKYERYLPYLLTIFFFIFINNLMGLVPFFPGGANLTGDISVTLVLALFTFVITSFSGSRDYWVHLVNAPGIPWWLKFPLPLMPIVEIMGVFIKPFVLTIRLFANITAGHIVALGFYSLIFIFAEKSIFAGYGISVLSIAFTVFMGILELLVAFIQAYVFTLLSALYIGLALERHEHHA
jgi:F-type H+-transporting ATPase subunit a